MGWFDKKSWQLRRKIRDLQSELAVAEREGKYVMEQGLFFAELREMADATMMVLGTAEHLDAEEETVIRNFFDRNGFSVDELRLDKTHKTLAAVEIIPPEELTRRVAKVLKENDYRLIDDSDRERPSNLEKRIITLSSLIRVISALFAAHVHQLIISTPIKLNMEGNRLLHWTPLIRESLMRKVSPEIAAVCRDPFIDAYNHYYGRFGKMTQPDKLDAFSGESSPIEEFEEAETEFAVPDMSADPTQIVRGDASEPWAEAQDESTLVAASGRDIDPKVEFDNVLEASSTQRAAEAAFVLAQMYKALIGASDQRRVRNAELLLDKIARFFSARSVCLLVRKHSDSPFALQANSGDSLCMDASQDGSACDTATLQMAVANRAVTVLSPSGNGDTNPQAVIIPISGIDNLEAVIYILEPGNFGVDVESGDSAHLTLFIRVFREFPDLLISEQKM